MGGIKVSNPTPPVSKKVVSIPVHYIGSDKTVSISGSRSASESDSAVKIQKVMRGYLVRKSMKKIAAIRIEVDGVEKSISNSETVELIRRDHRERMKVNEMLMRLLLKLDSVRGVDTGVRNCRKAVTKKAMALQEMVDTIADGDLSNDLAGAEKDVEQDLDEEVNNDDSISSDYESKKNPLGELQNDDAHIVLENQEGQGHSVSIEAQGMSAEEEPLKEWLDLNQGLQMNDEARGGEIDGKDDIASVAAPCDAEAITEVHGKVPDWGLNCENNVNVEGGGDDTEGKKEIDATPNPCEIEAIAEVKEGDPDTFFEQEEQMNDDVRGYEIEEKRETVGGEIDDECEGGETMGTCHGENQVALSMNPLVGLIEGDEGDSGKSSMGDDDYVRKVQEADSAGKRGVAKDGVKDDNTRTRELLDKMLMENEKMMGLMAGLFERNVMQTRLLSSLSQRVEQLEKAYWCERLRRTKKRNAAMGLTDCLESTLDSRRYGKKE